MGEGVESVMDGSSDVMEDMEHSHNIQIMSAKYCTRILNFHGQGNNVAVDF